METENERYIGSTFERFYERKLEEDLSDEDEDELDIEKAPQAILWEDFDQKVFQEQRWYVKNLIPKEGVVILASISGHKKTWIALDLCKDIASGKNFLDQEEFKTESGNVLYLNAENSESEIQRRGRMLNIKDTNKKLYIINANSINLNMKDGATWLKAFIEFNKIDVVFIDTFIAVAGGLKEEKSEEVRTFFRRFNCLKNQGVALVFLLHMRKPNHMEGKTPKKEQVLGSQDKVASSEILLMLYSNEGSEEINVYQRKNRLGREIKPFKILMQDKVSDQGSEIIELSYGGEIEETESKKDEAKDLILGILENGGKTTNQILELTNKQVGAKNTRAGLKELVAEELIIRNKLGKQNFYLLKDESVDEAPLFS